MNFTEFPDHAKIAFDRGQLSYFLGQTVNQPDEISFLAQDYMDVWLNGYSKAEKPFNTLLNKTVVQIAISYETVIFICNDLTTYALYHRQECCENVGLSEIIGGLKNLLYAPITFADESTGKIDLTHEPASDLDIYSASWSFYKLATIAGFVDIIFRGESNGCYSESATLYELTKRNP